MRHGQRNDLVQGTVSSDDDASFHEATGSTGYVTNHVHWVCSLDAYLTSACLRNVWRVS